VTDGSGRTSLRETVSLRPGVHCGVATSGEVFLVARPHSESLGQLSAGELAVLRRLSAVCAVEELAEANEEGLTRQGLEQLLDRLRAGGWLTTTVTCDGTLVYTMMPRGPDQLLDQDLPASGCTLSRFAVLRRDGRCMLVESPSASCELRIHEPMALAFIGSLTQRNRPDVSDSVEPEVARRLLVDLWRGGFLVRHNGTEEEMRLAQWSAHELWFHHNSSRSAAGAAGGFGGTYWAKRRFDPLPGRRESFGGRTIDLLRPDIDRLRVVDTPLTAVIEDRYSVRECDDDAPLTVDQLGEFLFRCARVRATAWHSGQEVSDRPYPTGGSVHELEIYPLVRRVSGIQAGLYHYDAYSHQLGEVPAKSAAAEALLKWAGLPQVLLVVTARFGRLMWKYEGMGYTLMLKHVGVLYQNMYLIATAMGLAPCALALGGNDFFAEATGLDQLVESSVGAFGLGSRRSSSSPKEILEEDAGR
jgi:SagB-type dehydrogenase family enzyme